MQDHKTQTLDRFPFIDLNWIGIPFVMHRHLAFIRCGTHTHADKSPRRRSKETLVVCHFVVAQVRFKYLHLFSSHSFCIRSEKRFSSQIPHAPFCQPCNSLTLSTRYHILPPITKVSF